MTCLVAYINSNYIINTVHTIYIMKMIYSAFMIGWVSVLLIMWIPHLSSLSIQIWRTKVMLNLIPLIIIQRYDRLKEAFLHSNII